MYGRVLRTVNGKVMVCERIEGIVINLLELGYLRVYWSWNYKWALGFGVQLLRFAWMVGWPWSRGSEGADWRVGDMDSGGAGAHPHVEKDVLAAGRNACYKARDAFFKCVEADSGHTTPTEIASVGLLYPAQCKSARALYEQNCRSTWVKHFDRQYCRQKRTKRLLDTGDRSRGPINLPANRVGLQPNDQ